MNRAGHMSIFSDEQWPVLRTNGDGQGEGAGSERVDDVDYKTTLISILLLNILSYYHNKIA
jgi:hypothetical protein